MSSIGRWASGAPLACAVLIAACSDSSGSGSNAGSSATKKNGVAAATAGGSAAGSGAAGSGSGGASGKKTSTGSAGSIAPAFTPTGEKITAPDTSWTWIDFPDAHCRDGSTAGIGVSFKPSSKKLMIYLEGGGACFDPQTCATNSPAVTGKQPMAAGLFDRTQVNNPVKDWNFVYVPYCTGDVHIGTNDAGSVNGVNGTQHFVGRLNLKAFLNRLVPTFADAEQVLLTGVSAGGFGASANAEFVQSVFGSVPVTMIDDSGPPMSSTYAPTCLQQLWRTTWGLDDSVLKECGDDCPNPNDFELDYTKHVAKSAGDRMSGLIESSQDAIIRGFYGIGTNNGANDCKGILLVTSVDANAYTQGLLEFRMFVKDVYPNFATYYPNSTQHTWLGGTGMYSETAGSDSVKMVDWVSDILAGKQAGHVGP